MTGRDVGWGKIFTGPDWWGEEGIYPCLKPVEFKVCVYLSARIGELQIPVILTVEQVAQAIQAGIERTREALKLLEQLGLFISEKTRDDNGQFIRRWQRVPPDQWNRIEVDRFIFKRYAKQKQEREKRSKRAAKSGVLKQGYIRIPNGYEEAVVDLPIPQDTGVASPAENENRHPRKPVVTTPAESPEPTPQTAGCIEEVEEDEEEILRSSVSATTGQTSLADPDAGTYVEGIAACRANLHHTRERRSNSWKQSG